MHQLHYFVLRNVNTNDRSYCTAESALYTHAHYSNLTLNAHKNIRRMTNNYTGVSGDGHFNI